MVKCPVASTLKNTEYSSPWKPSTVKRYTSASLPQVLRTLFNNLLSVWTVSFCIILLMEQNAIWFTNTPKLLSGLLKELYSNLKNLLFFLNFPRGCPPGQRPFWGSSEFCEGIVLRPGSMSPPRFMSRPPWGRWLALIAVVVTSQILRAVLKAQNCSLESGPVLLASQLGSGSTPALPTFSTSISFSYP